MTPQIAEPSRHESVRLPRSSLGHGTRDRVPGMPGRAARSHSKRADAPYDRSRDLAGLLPLWASEVADESPHGRRLVIAKLQRALREERRRGKSGHWAYDLARHWALYRALRCEREAAGETAAPPPAQS